MYGCDGRLTAENGGFRPGQILTADSIANVMLSEGAELPGATDPGEPAGVLSLSDYALLFLFKWRVV